MKNFAERLKSARAMKGYSLQDLADALGNQVTKQALSKYEQALMKPEPKLLLALSNALGVRPDYFSREMSITLENVEFRKLKKLSAKDSESIRERAIDKLERYFELEDLLGIDAQFVNPIGHAKINSHQEVEAVVEVIREEWKLGEDPLNNVIELLEDNHIKVIELECADDFSGLATWEGIKNPVIVVNERLPLDRKRFTALHELGHILMKLDHLEEKERERYCHAFAGAMLVPKKQLMQELGPSRSNVHLGEWVLLKQQFGMSVQGLAYRAKDLNIVSESFYRSFMTDISRMGYRKHEPWQYKGYEKSNRFMQLLYRAMAEEIISTSKAAALNNQKLADFRDRLDQYAA